MPEPTPYLVASVAYLALAFALAAFTVRHGHARLMALAAAVHLPTVLFAPTFEPGYWSPERTLGGPIGPEDVVVTAAIAAWAWYLVAVRYGRRLEAAAGLGTAFRRSLVPGALVFGAYLAAWAVGIDAMTSLLLTCVGGIVVLAGRHPDQRGMALWGALSLAVVWSLLVAATYAFFPEFQHDWNLHGPWGRRIGGVPLGEVVWAAIYGAFWPLFFGHVFAVRLRPVEAGSASRSDTSGPADGRIGRPPA